jgi:enolase
MGNDKFVIEDINGIQIIDSRGNPTIRVKVKTKGGITGYGDAPSGASKSSKEAIELRDGNKNYLHGRSVKKAVEIVNSYIRNALIGLDVRDQIIIDNILITMDSTENKSKLGGNTCIATSIAVANTASKALGIEIYEYLGGFVQSCLPIPILNIINGGLHGGNKLSIQEFIILPIGFKSFSESLFSGVQVYMNLRDLINSKYGKHATTIGDEGGFSPPISKSSEAFDLINSAIENSGYKPGKEIYLGVDAAASNFFNHGKYSIDERLLEPMEFLEYLRELANNYKLLYLEDPFEENQIQLYAELNKNLTGKSIIVGDDIVATNNKILNEIVKKEPFSGVIVKPNQAGTLTETFMFSRSARKAKLKLVVSHRSGDTESSFLADLAVGLGAELIKSGAPARGERIAKYNRLLEIENSKNIPLCDIFI